MYFTIGTVKLSNQDRELIRDSWERIDCAADRGEECEPTCWQSFDQITVVIDSNGDIWHDDLLLAYRDADCAVAVGSMERIRIC